MKFVTHFAFAAMICTGVSGQALAQANPVLGKTIDCGGLKATFSKSGEVSIVGGGQPPRKGTLKVMDKSVSGRADIKDLQILDAKGQFMMHFQQFRNGRYEIQGESCRLR